MSERNLSRRSFLAGTAVTATAACLGVNAAVPAAKALAENVDPAGEWVRTTCSPNCTGACGLKGFVHEGQIKMISQASDYPFEQYNPRGCLKGLSINTMLYGPHRLTTPLVKNDDTGKMEEADWNTALDAAAAKLRAVMDKYGPESVGVIWQVQGTGHIQKGSIIRLSNMMGWSAIGCYEMNGDLPMFWPETFGVQSEELESYCWEDSKYTMIFGSNVMVTRLPDAHFLNISRENGGKVVNFDPNYSATSEKSTEWVRLKPDTDAAFALAVAKIIIDDGLYDEAFCKNFTDMPLLVDTATGKRIEAANVVGLSAFSAPAYRSTYVAINAAGAPFAVNPERLGGMEDCTLEYTGDIRLKDGTTVHAKSGFRLLRESLVGKTAQWASDTTSIPVETIERIAQECATIKPMHIIFGGAGTQWYHGDLKGRSLALIAALTGNIGQLGGGISTYVGQYKTRFIPASWFNPPRMNKHSMSFQYAVTGRTETMQQNAFPPNGLKALVVGWGNPMDQHNVANWLRSAKESGELECLVTLDFQRTTTVDMSDVALPAPSWYEKLELTTTPLHPWVQLQQQMVDPPGEARPEIWICKELATHIDPSYADQWPVFDESQAEQVADEVLRTLLANGGPYVNQLTAEQLREGPGKLWHANPGEKRIPFWSQIHEGTPFPSQSLPNAIDVTAPFVRSGRIQFYRDEDEFLELGEQLPCYKPAFEDTEYKDDPEARTKYPLAFITRNSTYRVHSTYVNNPFMLELQNSMPKIFMNPDDAKERGLEAGDLVEAYNGRGKCQGGLVLDPGMYPGQAIFDQGWWSEYMDGDSYNSLIYPWINPTNEVYYLSGVWSPNMAWNECACNVRLLQKGGARKEVMQ